MLPRTPCAGALLSWLICHDVFRRRRVFGAVTGRMPAEWVTSGFVKRVVSLEELARQCGVDGDGLVATVRRFNGFARSGTDIDFHRGESAYDRFMGDPRRRPNTSLAAIERGPFYATSIYPGDVRTFGRLMTD